VESLLQDCCSFSWQKKATKGSSFFALRKTQQDKKAWNGPACRQASSGISF